MLDKNSLPNIDRVALPLPPLADFVPVSSHYDFNTLITKDGNLLQVIEVVGFENKTLDASEEIELRQLVRDTIRKCIPDFSYSVHLHTIRSRKNLMPSGHLPFGFAKLLNDKWCKKNNWDKQLTNTLYITIIRQGPTHKLFDLSKLFKSLVFPLYKKSTFAFLDQANAELTDVVTSIVSSLKKFGSKRLSLVKTNKGYLSEPLFFYYHLIHLSHRRTPLPVKDLSEYLSNLRIDFKFNSAEVLGVSDRQYAAMFTLKDQVEIPDEMLDRILQSGTQFIISQAICFVPHQEVKPKFEEYMDYYKINKAEILSELTGIKELVDGSTGKATDYCKQQTTILIHSDDPKFFESKTLQAVKTFHEIGLVTVREDFNLPRLFWSQLPGNFKYLSRFSYLPTSKIGLFTNIHSKTAGSYRGTKWGAPVSLLRKIDGSPYYFNFHNKNGNGNTLIVGPVKSGKTTFLRFFLAQSTRLVPRIIYIDVEGKSQNYIEALGGKYFKITADQPAPFKINPFDPDNFGNIEDYYKDWLIHAIYPSAASTKIVQDLFEAIAKKLIQDPEPNKLELLTRIIHDSGDKNLIERFNQFVGSERFANLFSPFGDELKFFDSENIIGINISELETDMQLFNSYLGILLHKIGKCLDGKPTVIAMNKSFMIYDIPSYCHLFGDWLANVNRNNAVALLSTEKPSESSYFQDFYQHVKYFGLQIFLSDKFADKYFKKSFGLTETELHKVKSYSTDKRMFVLKQDNISLVLSLPLKELQDELNILVS